MVRKEKVIQRGHALCPLDGRYGDVGELFGEYFSEFALMKYRLMVECLWLDFLSAEVLPHYPEIYDSKFFNQEFSSLFENFNDVDFTRIKAIEKKTNHDVKAVEYFIDEKLDKMGKGYFKSLVHIGCTSEDINSAAYALMIRDGINNLLLRKMEKLTDTLVDWIENTSSIPMLAHTHGQPATPTTLGKEIRVFFERFNSIIESIENCHYIAKWSGATGNYSAITFAFPKEDWIKLSNEFLKDSLGLEASYATTQIEPHDWMCGLFNDIRRFSNVLIDLDQDFWLYISMNYIRQKTVKGEVGSSTMPHKVNPIQFENSESNCKTGNALLSMFSDKLSISRMQRDLSDSSTLRNVGMAIAYIYQAISQTIKGLSRSAPNVEKIEADLQNNWEVLAEPIQTMLRKYGNPNAYEILKNMTRGKNISKEDIQEFVKTLDFLSEEDRKAIMNLTPSNYTGYATELADIF